MKSTGEAILVTGGTGFIGGAVVRALLDRVPAGDLRLLSRRPLPEPLRAAGVGRAQGDLREPSSLKGVCDGVKTVLHLASYVGRDPLLCDEVNRGGAVALLAEADRAGVERLVCTSTTAVYGAGAHRGVSESDVEPVPVSAASRGRLAAERAVRAWGGVVLRPHLVYGRGDTWFVPTLVRFVQRVPAWIMGGAAKTSVVAVDDLARVVAALAVSGWDRSAADVFHVSAPEPLTMRELVTEVCAALGVPPPSRDLVAEEHRSLARRELPDLTDHQFELLSTDHWYDSDRIWRHVREHPGPGFRARFAEAAPWYRTALAA